MKYTAFSHPESIFKSAPCYKWGRKKERRVFFYRSPLLSATLIPRSAQTVVETKVASCSHARSPSVPKSWTNSDDEITLRSRSSNGKFGKSEIENTSALLSRDCRLAKTFLSTASESTMFQVSCSISFALQIVQENAKFKERLRRRMAQFSALLSCAKLPYAGGVSYRQRLDVSLPHMRLINVERVLQVVKRGCVSTFYIKGFWRILLTGTFCRAPPSRWRSPGPCCRSPPSAGPCSATSPRAGTPAGSGTATPAPGTPAGRLQQKG